MLEALFGGIISFITIALKSIISVTIESIIKDLKLNNNQSRDITPIKAANNLRDINKEISGREKSFEKTNSVQDKYKLEELIQQRDEEYQKYETAKKQEAQNEIESNPNSFTEAMLLAGAEHKLQYHLGVSTISKKCPHCQRPMKLQHKTIDNPQFGDFFWQCSGFYIPTLQCKKTISFKPNDLSMLHKADVIELQLEKEDLITIANEPLIQTQSVNRMRAHLGTEDIDVMCPTHLIPMFLREKKDGENLPILDRYHLGCNHPTCRQITKLKSFPQLAAFLRRKEGDGLIY